MLGSQLHRLAAVAAIARTEFDTAPIILNSDKNRIQASYHGTYSAGVVAAEADTPSFMIAVNAKQFSTMANLFSDTANVTIQYTKKALKLSTKDRAVSLTASSDDIDEDILSVDDAPTDLDSKVVVKAKDIVGELSIASDFVAKSMAKPILTGVMINFSKNGLTFVASDGFAGVYRSGYQAECDNESSIVVMGEDCIMGLKLCNDMATIGVLEADRIVIYSDNSYFYAATLGGEWPDFSALTKKQDRTSISVPTSTIKDLVTSAAALQASTDIELVGLEDKTVIMRTVANEAGAVAIAIGDGELVGTYRYDGGMLVTATKLGDPLTVEVPSAPDVPTKISKERRQYWISTKVR